MRVLRSLDPLPRVPRRVTVAGSSGSGKSSLAKELSELLNLPYVELDSLFHGPGWTVLDNWQDSVREIIRGDEWAIEWQGDPVRAETTERADVLVWLDHPRWLTVARTIRRTVRRRFAGVELWNGNKELPLHTFFTDRDHIVRWAWKSHPDIRARVVTLIEEGGHPHLIVVRLRGQREVDAWLRGPLRQALLAHRED